MNTQKNNNYSDNTNIGEEYYLRAISNLIKKNNFLDLSLQLAEEMITEEEFESEINRRPQKYTINLECLKSKDDIHTIIHIVKQIGGNFMVDEVAELFGIKESELENSVSNLQLNT